MTRSKAINKNWLVAERHVVVEKIKPSKKVVKKESNYDF